MYFEVSVSNIFISNAIRIYQQNHSHYLVNRQNAQINICFSVIKNKNVVSPQGCWLINCPIRHWWAPVRDIWSLKRRPSLSVKDNSWSKLQVKIIMKSTSRNNAAEIALLTPPPSYQGTTNAFLNGVLTFTSPRVMYNFWPSVQSKSKRHKYKNFIHIYPVSN